MSDAPGWDAIDAALKAVYGAQAPQHFGTVIPYELGGPDPLRGLSVYARTDPDHWHIVTYGFTELFDKETQDAAVSGYGFELTLRVARAPGEEKVPPWPLGFLQNLARYVFQTGNVFREGDHMPLNGPIRQGADTAIHSMAVGRDPDLGEFESANGKATFLQVVGIANDERDLIMEWDTRAFLEELAREDRWMLTDLRRRSMLADPVRAARLRERAEKDGSSMGMTFFADGRFLPGPPHVWELGALYVDGLLRGLKGRTQHGRSFEMVGETLKAELVLDARDSVAMTDRALRLHLSRDTAKAMLGSLKPRRGEYAWPGLPGFVLRVVPTPVTDPQGNVVETVG